MQVSAYLWLPAVCHRAPEANFVAWGITHAAIAVSGAGRAWRLSVPMGRIRVLSAGGHDGLPTLATVAWGGGRRGDRKERGRRVFRAFSNNGLHHNLILMHYVIESEIILMGE